MAGIHVEFEAHLEADRLRMNRKVMQFFEGLTPFRAPMVPHDLERLVECPLNHLADLRERLRLQRLTKGLDEYDRPKPVDGQPRSAFAHAVEQPITIRALGVQRLDQFLAVFDCAVQKHATIGSFIHDLKLSEEREGMSSAVAVNSELPKGATNNGWVPRMGVE